MGREENWKGEEVWNGAAERYYVGCVYRVSEQDWKGQGFSLCEWIRLAVETTHNTSSVEA